MIRLAAGGVRVKLHTIRYHIEKYLTAENAEIILNFFLGDLCALCGELFCFFHDQTGRRRPAAALIGGRLPHDRGLSLKFRYNIG